MMTIMYDVDLKRLAEVDWILRWSVWYKSEEIRRGAAALLSLLGRERRAESFPEAHRGGVGIVVDQPEVCGKQGLGLIRSSLASS